MPTIVITRDAATFAPRFQATPDSRAELKTRALRLSAKVAQRGNDASGAVIGLTLPAFGAHMRVVVVWCQPTCSPSF
jgi:hypothetical protein